MPLLAASLVMQHCSLGWTGEGTEGTVILEGVWVMDGLHMIPYMVPLHVAVGLANSTRVPRARVYNKLHELIRILDDLLVHPADRFGGLHLHQRLKIIILSA